LAEAEGHKKLKLGAINCNLLQLSATKAMAEGEHPSVSTRPPNAQAERRPRNPTSNRQSFMADLSSGTVKSLQRYNVMQSTAALASAYTHRRGGLYHEVAFGQKPQQQEGQQLQKCYFFLSKSNYFLGWHDK
jgi:hypothetical protein